MQLRHMNATFLHCLPTSSGTPDPRAVWEGFLAFARRPVELDGVAPSYTEDFLVFESIVADDGAPELRLCRTIGLAGETGDYVESRHFECTLLYPRSADRPDEGSIWASAGPDEAPAVDTFVADVQASVAFRILVAEGRPERLVIAPDG